MKFLPGCCNCSGSVTFTLHVDGCVSGGNLGGVGAAVVVTRSGTTYFTGTTDASSNLTGTFSAPTTGQTYTLTVTPTGSRQAVLTTTHLLNFGTNSGFSASLLPVLGYHCCAVSEIPLINTFDMSDSFFAGNHPMTISSHPQWESGFYGGGQASLTVGGAFSFTPRGATFVSISAGPPYTIVYQDTPPAQPTRTYTITNA